MWSNVVIINPNGNDFSWTFSQLWLFFFCFLLLLVNNNGKSQNDFMKIPTKKFLSIVPAGFNSQ